MMLTRPDVGLSFPVNTTLMKCGSTDGSHLIIAWVECGKFNPKQKMGTNLVYQLSVDEGSRRRERDNS